MEQSADPNFMYNQARGYTEQNFDQILDQELQDPSKRDFRGWLANSLGMDSAAAKQDGSWAQDGNWFFSGYGAPGSPQRQKFIEDQMARKGWEMVKQQCVNTMLKAARCWAGYEPVPGAKAYSEGSCRPKGSKKTKKEVIQGKKRTEKKAAGPKQPSPQQVAYSAWQKSQKPPIKPQPTATPTANTAKVPGNQFLQPTR
jgi:hypothetical protein